MVLIEKILLSTPFIIQSKDLKTNKTFIIKRDNIHIYYESAGIKLFSM